MNTNQNPETSATGEPLATGKEGLQVEAIDWHARYQEADDACRRCQEIMGDSDPTDDPAEMWAQGIIPGDEVSDRVLALYNAWRQSQATVAAQAAVLRTASSGLKWGADLAAQTETTDSQSHHAGRALPKIEEAEALVRSALSPDAGKALLEEVERLRAEKAHWQDGRRQGREEALQILIEYGAEDFEDFIGSEPSGEDYMAVWKYEDLRKLFDADERHSLVDRLGASFWELQGYKDGYTAAPGWMSPERVKEVQEDNEKGQAILQTAISGLKEKLVGWVDDCETARAESAALRERLEDAGEIIRHAKQVIEGIPDFDMDDLENLLLVSSLNDFLTTIIPAQPGRVDATLGRCENCGGVIVEGQPTEQYSDGPIVHARREDCDSISKKGGES